MQLHVVAECRTQISKSGIMRFLCASTGNNRNFLLATHNFGNGSDAQDGHVQIKCCVLKLPTNKTILLHEKTKTLPAVNSDLNNFTKVYKEFTASVASTFALNPKIYIYRQNLYKFSQKKVKKQV